MKINPDKIITEHLEFRKEFEDKYQCYNKFDERLGCLTYEKVGRHMHWCWYQYDSIRMSPCCLQNVRDIQKKLLSIRNKRH